jgi:hypothetical protein
MSANAVQLVDERPAHFWEGPSNPVLLERKDRRDKIIPHLVSPAKPPTKYRRPSEGRRDSFGGGQPKAATFGSDLLKEDTAGKPVGQRGSVGAEELTANLRATFRAISRRYPLTGDCFLDGETADDENAYDSVVLNLCAFWQNLLQVGRLWRSCLRMNPATIHKAVPSGRCFRFKCRIRQGAGLNKPVITSSSPEGCCLNSLGRLPSQFDRNSGCLQIRLLIPCEASPVNSEQSGRIYKQLGELKPDTVSG